MSDTRCGSADEVFGNEISRKVCELVDDRCVVDRSFPRSLNKIFHHITTQYLCLQYYKSHGIT